MKRSFLLVLFSAFTCVVAAAQKMEPAKTGPEASQAPTLNAADLAAKAPPARLEDVGSLDAIMRSVNDVISGPAGDRDWNRFRSIFLPQARFTQAIKTPEGGVAVVTWGVDEFILDAHDFFAEEAFYEKAIVNRPQSFGNVTQVFSSYESRHSPGEKPFQRGINSIKLLNDGKRLWVVSILWDAERPDNPLPRKFAARH